MSSSASFLASLAAVSVAATAGLAATDAPPAAPPKALAAWIAVYGRGDAAIDVFEAGGALHAAGAALRSDVPLTPLGGGRFIASTRDGSPVALAFARQPDGRRSLATGGTTRPEHDLGAEVQAEIRRGAQADWSALRRRALEASPPAEPPPRRSANLVRVTAAAPTVRLDIRYAGSDNFMGAPLYERADAFLQRPAAQALARVQAALAVRGLGLVIYDAYRPWFVTRMFWDATPPASRIFVADPAKGSRHNRGCAVDLGLVELRTGRVIEMPSRFDEFSPRAYPDYAGGSTRRRWFRDTLRAAMEREGFSVYPQEWWHFDYRHWADYPVGDQTFSDLAPPTPGRVRGPPLARP